MKVTELFFLFISWLDQSRQSKIVKHPVNNTITRSIPDKTDKKYFCPSHQIKNLTWSQSIQRQCLNLPIFVDQTTQTSWVKMISITIIMNIRKYLKRAPNTLWVVWFSKALRWRQRQRDREKKSHIPKE